MTELLVFLANRGLHGALISTGHGVIFVFQMRDLKAVGRKFMHVLYPRKSNALLRDCEYMRFLRISFKPLIVYWFCFIKQRKK
jgi:hypothetical protein